MICICPICKSPLEDPPDIEETYHSIYCDCGCFTVHFWDREVLTKIVEILVDLRTFKIIFCLDKTDIYEIFYTGRYSGETHGVHDNLEWSELITTLSPIIDIPQDLASKVKIWITFS